MRCRHRMPAMLRLGGFSRQALARVRIPERQLLRTARGPAGTESPFSSSFHRDVPDLFATRLALGTFHFQGYRVVGAFRVLADGLLLRRTAPIAEIPLPDRRLARSQIGRASCR